MAQATGIVEEWAELRPLLFSIAYRMVSSVSEAEDLVQESFLRLHRALERGEEIRSPKAYLSAVITRLAIDHLRSARVRREQYVGTWLPEPLMTEGTDDAAAAAELGDTLSMAFLLLLETLSPVERAAFVLHDVFGYGYDEVADIVGKSNDNARQLTARARKHIDERRPRFEASREKRDELANAFLAATLDGDVKRLESMLATDAAAWGDGGGKADAILAPIHGRTQVARFLAAIGRIAVRDEVTVRATEVNGQPALIGRDAGGQVLAVLTLETSGGTVHAVRGVVNPDKLAHLRP